MLVKNIEYFQEKSYSNRGAGLTKSVIASQAVTGDTTLSGQYFSLHFLEIYWSGVFFHLISHGYKVVIGYYYLWKRGIKH